MKGKEKCRILKQIRQQIADANNIEYITRECTHKGDCRGTCPRCEAEVRYLEEQLELRRKRGAKVAIAAVAAGIMLTTTTACDFDITLGRDKGGAPPAEDIFENPAPTAEEDVIEGELAMPEYELTGDVAYVEPQETEVAEQPTMGEPPVEDEIWETDEPLEGDVEFVPENEVTE